MNRLILARSGFEDLRAVLAVGQNEQTSNQAESWLRDQVSPVVDELLDSRSFKLAARWSLDHVVTGANTDERRLIEAVDKALVACAAVLADITLSASSEEVAGHTEKGFQRFAISAGDRFAVKWIAGRPWFDLVNPAEFFHPKWDLHFRQSSSEHTDSSIRESVGQLTAAFRKRTDLRVPLGDYILRSLFARIDFWKSILDRVSIDVLTRSSDGGQKEYQAMNRVFEAKIKLDEQVEKLTKACRAGNESRRREAAATLIQVYAAYSPSPNLSWLGLPPGWGPAYRGAIQMCVRPPSKIVTVEPTGPSTARVVDCQHVPLWDLKSLQHIAEGLWDVIPHYEMPEDPDELIAWAVDRARLVMVDRSPRAVYWDREAVAAGAWDGRPQEWNFLWTLAQNPGRVVDHGMLMQPDQHPIKSRRHKLANQLNECLALDNMICTDRGLGYRLDLKTDEILRLHDTGSKLVFEGQTRDPLT